VLHKDDNGLYWQSRLLGDTSRFVNGGANAGSGW
jgi:hypothetical protein